MPNSRWFFRGVKGDQIGPVSSETMYSLLAQGTLTSETQVAASDANGEPDFWVEAGEVVAFRERIEARGAREPKRAEAREFGIQNVARASTEGPNSRIERDREDRLSGMRKKSSGPWPLSFLDVSFQTLVTPRLAKVIWVLTFVLGSIWIVYNLFHLGMSYFRSPSMSQGEFGEEQMYRQFAELEARAYFWLYGLRVVAAVATILHVRVMLEIITVFFRIGKVLGCTEGEPKCS